MKYSDWPKFPITPIKLEFTDLGKFADMAYFFDHPEVIQAIADARKVWLGDGALLDHREMEKYMASDGDRKIPYKEFQEYKLFGRKIAQRFRKPVNYVRPIISAILSGEVHNEDYQTVIFQNPDILLPKEIRNYSKIVHVSQRISVEDVKELNQKNGFKIHSSIIKKRDIFLESVMDKKGYKKLKKDKPEPTETIISQVKSYREEVQKAFDHDLNLEAHILFDELFE